MKMPKGLTEEEVLAAVENVVRVLAPSFPFGVYDIDDIKQEARIMALEVLDSYDPQPDEDGKPTRPLENLMYVTTYRKLLNLVRNKLFRNEPPCKICNMSQGRRSDHPSGEWCRAHVEWKRRNSAKASLMQPANLDKVPEGLGADPGGVQEEAEMNEVLRLIDEKLPVELRATYLQMRAGRRVSKARRLQVEVAVREILGRGGHGEGGDAQEGA